MIRVIIFLLISMMFTHCFSQVEEEQPEFGFGRSKYVPIDVNQVYTTQIYTFRGKNVFESKMFNNYRYFTKENDSIKIKRIKLIEKVPYSNDLKEVKNEELEFDQTGKLVKKTKTLFSENNTSLGRVVIHIKEDSFSLQEDHYLVDKNEKEILLGTLKIEKEFTDTGIIIDEYYQKKSNKISDYYEKHILEKGLKHKEKFKSKLTELFPNDTIEVTIPNSKLNLKRRIIQKGEGYYFGFFKGSEIHYLNNENQLILDKVFKFSEPVMGYGITEFSYIDGELYRVSACGISKKFEILTNKTIYVDPFVVGPTYSYNFDERNNWIYEKIEVGRNGLFRIVEREINYYEN